jgi:hypothetical protein
LDASESAAGYTSEGYETGTSTNIANNEAASELEPLTELTDSLGEYSSLSISFNGYEDHDIYAVLLEDADDETVFDSITVDQIMSGLDYNNQPAV